MTVRANTMKLLGAFVFLLLVLGCVNTASEVRNLHAVVIPGDWTPTDQQVRQCERAVAARVPKDARAWMRLGAVRSIDRYNVRMYAVTRNGRRVIAGYGCDRNEPGSALYLEPDPESNLGKGERPVPLQPFGGGLGYFWFTYDCDSRALDFSFGAAL